MPTTMSTPCQIKNIHGNVNATANAAGFARIYINLGANGGAILSYADATANETTLGVFTYLLAYDADFNSGPSRVVAAGLRMRSMTSVLNDAGTV